MKNAIKREPCKLVCRWPSVSILCNKQSIITTLLAFVAMAGQAQELKINSQSQIKRVAATPEDFMEHMAMYGYEVLQAYRHHRTARSRRDGRAGTSKLPHCEL